MNFDGNYKLIGKVDVKDLVARILEYTEEDWNCNDYRQREFGTHKDTATIPLIFDKDFRHVNPTKQPEYQSIEGFLQPVYSLIRLHFNKSLKYKRLQEKNGKAYPVRTILARLRPGGIIPEHMDRNHSLSHGHRIHIPLQTDEGVVFSVGGVRQPLKVGEVWEINNRHAHFAENKSDIYRIHLIVDWAIPGERCCCGTKANPQGTCSETACYQFDFRIDPCNCYS